jgi:hypothetical protein
MIPESGRALINLHMSNAEKTESDSYAEECLAAASAMLGYACACNHLSPADYSNELVLINLARAKRLNRASARS